MKLTLIISLVLAVATSLWTWVPWHSGSTAGTGLPSALLTATGKPVTPESVADLRVAAYDSAEKAPKVFEVARKQKKWVIPSHFDYPADGGSKVGDTAGAVLNLQRGPLVSSRKEDQADLGVVDPLSEDNTATGAEARGRRITLKDEGGGTLIDLIIGKSPAGQTDLHYVRMVGSDEIVTAKVDPSAISTAFRDWVEADPIKVNRADIKRLTIRDYSINESEGTIAERTTTALESDKNVWTSKQTPADKQTKQETVESLLSELSGLRLVGVRPFDPRWLSRRGFYTAQKPDGSLELLSNDGELEIVTQQGLRYRLFFGAIAFGDEQDTVATPTTKPSTKPTGNNRYMAALVSYDPKLDQSVPPATQPALAAPSSTQPASQPTSQPAGPTPQQIEAGEKLAKEKNARFSQFFYVIGNDTFEKLRPNVASIFEVKPPPATAPAGASTQPSAVPVIPTAPEGPDVPSKKPSSPSTEPTIPTSNPAKLPADPTSSATPAVSPPTTQPASTAPASPATGPATAPATQSS